MEWFSGNGMVFGEWNGFRGMEWFSGNIKTTGYKVDFKVSFDAPSSQQSKFTNFASIH